MNRQESALLRAAGEFVSFGSVRTRTILAGWLRSSQRAEQRVHGASECAGRRTPELHPERTRNSGRDRSESSNGRRSGSRGSGRSHLRAGFPRPLRAAASWALGFLGCLGFLGAPVHAQSVGDTVARLELESPNATSFIVHGTIPVPPNTFPRPDGKSPFKVRSGDGTLIPAQTERVSTYPNGNQGADVVEIIARIQRPASSSPGQYVQYDVVYAPHLDAPTSLTTRVTGIRNTPNSLVLRTRDVFGHMYRSDLRLGALDRRTLKSGSSLLQERCYDVLRPAQPQGGAQATLPHLMGVHAYLSYFANEDIIQLDLRVHNATSGADRSATGELDDVQRQLYFDQLELVVPIGWTVISDFNDPSSGTPRVLGPARVMYPLVKANSDGTLHVIGQQAQFERRVAIVRDGLEARARELIEERFLAFSRPGRNTQGAELWSWWNATTSRYYPQRHRLPNLNYLGDVSGLNTTRGKLSADLNHVLDYFHSGASMGLYPLFFERQGWAHPWGVQYGGMTSGNEIYAYDGFVTAYAASNDGYRYTLLRHRMYTDRMPDALFDMNGDPTSMFEWVVHGASFDYIPCNFFQVQLNGPDMLGFNAASTHQMDFAHQSGLAPAYEGDLLAFDPIDLQHLVRYLNSPKTLAWLGNDSVAKDDLLMQAEIARMSYNDLPVNSGGATIPSSMLSDWTFISSLPDKGFAFGRGEGWTIDAMCAAYSLAPQAWRTAARPWFDKITYMVNAGQASCMGMVQATVNTKILNGQHRARQSIEEAIVENALWSMRESVYLGVDNPRLNMLNQVLIDAAYALAGFPSWSDIGQGPYSHMAVGPLATNLPLYCSGLPDGVNATGNGYDKYQCWPTLAYGFELTGDTHFLQRVMDMAGPQFQTFDDAANSGFTNLENKCPLTALTADVDYP